jgi:hypothetical protein
VNHEVLLAKLKFYDINGVAGKLITSYLTDRHQRSLLNNSFSSSVSDWQEIKQGVPQAFIHTYLYSFFNLLFLVYINDMPYAVNKLSYSILYADDTSILCFNSNSNELAVALKEILEIRNKWFFYHFVKSELK